MLQPHGLHGTVQAALTRFIYAVFPDVGEDAGGVLAWAYHVILQAFREASPNLQPVSQEEIGAVITALAEAEAAQPEAGQEPGTSEVHAMQYAVDACAEDADVALAAKEVDYCLRMLWVAIECLHRAGPRT